MKRILTDAQAKKIAEELLGTSKNVFSAVEAEIGRPLQADERDRAYDEVASAGDMGRCSECFTWVKNTDFDFDDTCYTCAEEENEDEDEE